MTLTESYPKSLMEVGFPPKQVKILNGGDEDATNVPFLDTDNVFTGDNDFADITVDSINSIDTDNIALLDASNSFTGAANIFTNSIVAPGIGTASNVNFSIYRNNEPAFTCYNSYNNYSEIIVGNNSNTKPDGGLILGGESSGNLTAAWTTLCSILVEDLESVTGRAFFSASKHGGSGSRYTILNFARHTFGASRYDTSTVDFDVDQSSGQVSFRVANGSTAVLFQANTTSGTYQANCAVFGCFKHAY